MGEKSYRCLLIVNSIFLIPYRGNEENVRNAQFIPNTKNSLPVFE